MFFVNFSKVLKLLKSLAFGIIDLQGFQNLEGLMICEL
jgi:hypothetical protein